METFAVYEFYSLFHSYFMATNRKNTRVYFKPNLDYPINHGYPDVCRDCGYPDVYRDCGYPDLCRDCGYPDVCRECYHGYGYPDVCRECYHVGTAISMYVGNATMS